MDHVINREVAVALTTNIKDNVNWENIKLAYPFKNKCIKKISHVLHKPSIKTRTKFNFLSVKKHI